MTNGANDAGTIQVGDLDQWSVHPPPASGPHSPSARRRSAPTRSSQPWLRVQSDQRHRRWPSEFGGSTAQIDVAATIAGTYTVAGELRRHRTRRGRRATGSTLAFSQAPGARGAVRATTVVH